MNFDKLNTAGKEIERKLIEIRKSINAPIGIYIPKGPNNDGSTSGGDLADNAAKSPNQPIIIGGELHIVYIKDNYEHNKLSHNDEINSDDNPSRYFASGKKVHFYYCSTLKKMKRERRKDRYQRIREAQNTYLIDLNDVENLATRLAWCKNCIDILCHNGKVFRSGYTQIYSKYRKKARDKIAKYGDAKELMACVEAHKNHSPSACQEIQNFVKNTIGKK